MFGKKQKSAAYKNDNSKDLYPPDDDYVMKTVKLFKYFIVNKDTLEILDQIQLTEDQARKINDNIKTVAFIRQ